MIKQIYLLNSTMVGVLQSSNAGSPVIDAGKNALLAAKIKKALAKEADLTVKVKAVDEDDLKGGISADELLLMNEKVKLASKNILDNVENILIYNALDLSKEEFPQFIAKVATKINA